MAASFPASYDALTNPTSGSLLTSPSHATQHINANDVVEAIEQRVGLSGSSFPGSPSSGQFFHRTDRRINYYYDGTRWLGEVLHALPVPWSSTTIPLTGSGTITHELMVPHSGIYDLWLESLQATFYVTGGTALGASHKWVSNLDAFGGGSSTTKATVTIDSGASDIWRDSGLIAINAISDISGTNAMTFTMNTTKTGTPGTLHLLPMIYYRVIG